MRDSFKVERRKYFSVATNFILVTLHLPLTLHSTHYTLHLSRALCELISICKQKARGSLLKIIFHLVLNYF